MPSPCNPVSEAAERADNDSDTQKYDDERISYFLPSFVYYTIEYRMQGRANSQHLTF